MLPQLRQAVANSLRDRGGHRRAGFALGHRHGDHRAQRGDDGVDRGQRVTTGGPEPGGVPDELRGCAVLVDRPQPAGESGDIRAAVEVRRPAQRPDQHLVGVTGAGVRPLVRHGRRVSDPDGQRESRRAVPILDAEFPDAQSVDGRRSQQPGPDDPVGPELLDADGRPAGHGCRAQFVVVCVGGRLDSAVVGGSSVSVDSDSVGTTSRLARQCVGRQRVGGLGAGGRPVAGRGDGVGRHRDRVDGRRCHRLAAQLAVDDTLRRDGVDDLHPGVGDRAEQGVRALRDAVAVDDEELRTVRVGAGVGHDQAAHRILGDRRVLVGKRVAGPTVALTGRIPALQDVQVFALGQPVAVGVVVEALRGE